MEVLSSQLGNPCNNVTHTTPVISKVRSQGLLDHEAPRLRVSGSSVSVRLARVACEVYGNDDALLSFLNGLPSAADLFGKLKGLTFDDEPLVTAADLFERFTILMTY
jgi:hypothetical protein